MAAQRRGDIQGLRALAVVLVVVYHTRLALPGGFIGVDVFFVISGYVITRALVAELDRTGRLDYWTFYLRRIRRILPALAGLLLGVLALNLWLGPIGGHLVTGRTGTAAALFNANTYLSGLVGGLRTGYFDPDAELNTLLHTWSLSVEEQFYLGFPLLVGVSWWAARRWAGADGRRVAAVSLGLVGIASFVLSVYLTTTNGRMAFYLAPSRAWEFVAGAILVFVAVPASRIPVRYATGLAALGISAIAIATFAYDDRTAFPGVAALLPVVGTALLIIAGEGPTSNPIRRALEARPAQWLGDLSYSWYLWHWPLIVFAAATVPGSGVAKGLGAAVSLIPAFLSFKLIENPIRFRPTPSRAATLRVAQLCILLPLVVGLVFDFGRAAVAESPEAGSYFDDFAYHLDHETGCDSNTRLAERAEDCLWPAVDSTGTAILVGDSNAGQLSEGFVTGMTSMGYDAVIATKSGCPFADVEVIFDDASLTNCARFVENTTADLIEADPDIVVVASASDNYVQWSGFAFRSKDGTLAIEPSERADVWSEALRTTIEQLDDAGIDVVVVHPLPKIPEWDSEDCSVVGWSYAENLCVDEVPRTEAVAHRAAAVQAEISASAGRARTLDMFDDVCPGDACQALEDGFLRYRDGGHITVAQAEALAGRFAELIE